MGSLFRSGSARMSRLDHNATMEQRLQAVLTCLNQQRTIAARNNAVSTAVSQRLKHFHARLNQQQQHMGEIQERLKNCAAMLRALNQNRPS